MARLFTWGGECGDLLEFNTISGAVISTDAAHTGTYGLKGTANNHYAQKTISPTPNNELYVRTWWNPYTDSNGLIITVGTSDSSVDVRFNYVGNALTVRRGTTVIATGTIGIGSVDQWYMIELYVKLANSPDGVATVRIDGVEDIAFTGDTLSGSSAAITYVRFTTGGATGYHDDIAVNDTSGAADNSWCGDGRVIGIKPNAAGDNTDFTPSAGSNYQNVDEVPPDDDTTYNSSDTDGHYDLFNLEASGLSGVTILGVDVKVTARKTVANGDHMRAKIKTGSTEYNGDDKDILTSYGRFVQTWRTNPNTAAAWEIAEIDALQAGYENRAA